jgi:hypothetical protein
MGVIAVPEPGGVGTAVVAMGGRLPQAESKKQIVSKIAGVRDTFMLILVQGPNISRL